MERIPFPEKLRKLMKGDTKYVWVICPECGCEWECTEKKKEALDNSLSGPICINCFDTEVKKKL